MRYGVRKKRELVLWGILCVGLILLYLLSSTDWIIKEKEVEVYPVSLIISDTSDDDYVNFRKGVDPRSFPPGMSYPHTFCLGKNRWLQPH